MIRQVKNKQTINGLEIIEWDTGRVDIKDNKGNEFTYVGEFTVSRALEDYYKRV